ncbi:MAG: glutamine synthetase III [Thermoguttaceae bacterium]|nr:glutamine synthetase III [Thermoguttaceae bacterium]
MNGRTHAIESIAKDRREIPPAPAPEMPQQYGENVFSEEVIRRCLPAKTAEKLLATMRGERPLDSSIASEVAKAMKDWALSRGATHYTHWFQPLTGGTAEKHDAFLETPAAGKALMELSGKNLIMGEPDASSLPSGGLRCTFEARGYTAWDPTSPAFIKRHNSGSTLCIPTIFCSYTGEVLDKKTPLLRSIQILTTAVKRLMASFGLKDERVFITLGAEQEYFLIDRNFYLQRPDLVQTGRTLFGSAPAKHQQLEDHYFGSIHPRILAFMAEVENELWRLGIPAKTRHNEAAPAQFELASIFEEQNLSVDHNMLTMEILRQTAERHGLVCLLHEKPFSGVNGSGKHNNWSVSYGSRNLLDPGDNPHENAIFLTVLTAILRAVDLYSDLLRSTTAGAGNELRLGAGEAPPEIISVFLGEQLTDIIHQLEHGGATRSRHGETLRIGVDSLPKFSRDATDRNRTSPFAFTGNKFEFRAVGASQSCAGCNTVLNTIVADSFDALSDKIERFPKESFNEDLTALLGELIRKHKRIIFNGNNYSDEWIAEAQKRKLPNRVPVRESLAAMGKPKTVALFKKYKVFNGEELDSRLEVFLAEYRRKIRIEGRVALEMARTIILPAAVAYYQRLIDTVLQAEKAKLPARSLRQTAEAVGQKIDTLNQACDALEEAIPGQPEGIRQAMAPLRTVVDSLEQLIDDASWPLPKYREMLFLY